MTAPDLDPLEIEQTATGFTLLMYAGTAPAAPDVYGLGFEPNGHFWEGITRVLLQTRLPGLIERLAFSSDGDTLLIHGSDRTELEGLGVLVAEAVSDADLLRDLVDQADSVGVDIHD